MRAFPKAIILMSLVGITLTLGRIAAEAPQPGQNGPPPFDPGTNSNHRTPVDVQERDGELKMSIRASAP